MLAGTTGSSDGLNARSLRSALRSTTAILVNLTSLMPSLASLTTLLVACRLNKTVIARRLLSHTILILMGNRSSASYPSSESESPLSSLLTSWLLLRISLLH